jgi:hypothetical protein
LNAQHKEGDWVLDQRFLRTSAGERLVTYEANKDHPIQLVPLVGRLYIEVKKVRGVEFNLYKCKKIGTG